jgi:hypothetical protein
MLGREQVDVLTCGFSRLLEIQRVELRGARARGPICRRETISNRLLMYCAYIHLRYCLALVLCVALPSVSAGRAIRCLAGLHPSLSTPFLPTVGPLVGPARLSLLTIMLPLSNPYPWFYRLWAPPLGYLGYFSPLGSIRYLLRTPAVTFSQYWPVHRPARPAVVLALLSLPTSPSNGLWSLSLDANPSIGMSSLWHLSLSPQTFHRLVVT